MKLFSGFPSGKLQVTPLPNLFFSELLPAIEDVAELKLTLHVFWLLTRSKHSPGAAKSHLPYATIGELRSDVTLMRSLAIIQANAEQALERALTLAVERGTLLHSRLPADNGKPSEARYFLNTESGRRAFEHYEQGTPSAGEQSEPLAATTRPNIFVLYEQNIGLLTPLAAEELKLAEKEYPAEWIEQALKEAVSHNKRSWSYARSILERWKEQGRADPLKKGKPWYGDEYGKFVKR